MQIALGISVFLVCAYASAEAQLSYAKHYIPQQVKYDDEAPSYDGIPYKSSIGKEPLSNAYENAREAIDSQSFARTSGSPYPQMVPTSVHPPNPSLDHPQVVYYRQPESPTSYHSQDHTSQPEDLQLSHGIQHHRPSHMSVIYPQVPERQHHVPRPSHASLIHPAGTGYQAPKADPDHKQIYPVPDIQQQNVPQLSHASLIHPAEQGYQTPKIADQEHKPVYPVADLRQPSHATSIQPAEKGYPTPDQEYKQPADPKHPNSRVVRDPRLPLYFTMYEKRIIQDPVDKYGNGPWRYLTYGHGITYGSKEPGKVFERGYGYIRALGRDHCKLPENRCPQRHDDKPFEYEGRKEPYFGYRPH